MKRPQKSLFPACLLLLAIPAFSAGAASAAFAADEPSRLQDLFKREWENRLKEDPFLATSVGRHEYDDRLPSATFAELQREAAETKAFLA